MIRITHILFALLLAAPGGAQLSGVWIVDQANGPGTNFTSLAVAATSTQVVSGDTLRIRSGNYAAPMITKGLTLVPETWADSVAFHGTFSISGLGAGERCDLKRLHAEASTATELRCLNNVGSVHLETVDIGPISTQGLRASNCKQVTLNDCDLGFVEADSGSLVLITDCNILAATGQPFGLRVDSSEVILANSSVVGPPGLVDPFTCTVLADPGVGTEMLNGTLSITGPSGRSVGGTAQAYFCGLLAAKPGIAGTGTVATDPSTPTPHNGTVGVTVQSRVMPFVRMRFVATKTLQGSIWAPGSAGATAVLVAGVPLVGPPFNLAGIGRVWIDLSFFATVALPLNGNGEAQLNQTFSTSTSGALTFQAAIINSPPSQPLSLSTAAVVVINHL